MKKCLICGNNCTGIGGGKYECACCGNVFDEKDFVASKPVAVKTTTTATVNSGADIFEKNIYGILEITCRGTNASWSGSGYLLTPDGYAITNAHVAANEDGSPCENIIVKICNQSVRADVAALADDKAGSGDGWDLALIKLQSVPSNAKLLKVENYENVRNGEQVFVIGNSLGQGTCITSGIVSDKNRVVNGKPMLMTDCAVNGGNSGGPIFNGNGNVIGTITLQGRTRDGSNAEGMNYAIPSNIIVDFMIRCGFQTKIG